MGTPPRDEAGLTLVEMVVAVGIVLLVLISTLTVFIQTQRAQQAAEGSDRAIQLANSRIERVRQMDWASIGFYQNTYDTARVQAPTTKPYTIPLAEIGNEKTVIVGDTDPLPTAQRLRPYETSTAAEAANAFNIYTTITWYRGTLNGITYPLTSGTTGTSLADEYYSFKRVRVTITWRAGGTGETHEVVNESLIAPTPQDEAPPSVGVDNQ